MWSLRQAARVRSAVLADFRGVSPRDLAWLPAEVWTKKNNFITNSRARNSAEQRMALAMAASRDCDIDPHSMKSRVT